ncbi:MAG: hypothetical protein Q9222_004634, partial [Ikaeria aurantiellina]
MSIASSISQYRHENGRTYHAYRMHAHLVSRITVEILILRLLGDGQYWAPNDEKARSTDAIAYRSPSTPLWRGLLTLLPISHHAFLLSFNDKLFLAPIQKPRRALDVGCGIGVWAIDFAETYPDTITIATDLSPIQPGTKPPNLEFEVDDCCSDWVYENNHFDYIHVRSLYGSVADWPKFYKECYDHLAPGGYLEQTEFNPVGKSDDGSIVSGDPWDKCGQLARRCGEAFGKTLMVEEFMKEEIIKAGFTDVVKIKYKWPIGAWSNDPKLKELGRWNLIHWLEGLEGWTLRFFTKHMGWTYEATRKWNADMIKTLKDKKYHAYQDV